MVIEFHVFPYNLKIICCIYKACVKKRINMRNINVLLSLAVVLVLGVIIGVQFNVSIVKQNVTVLNISGKSVSIALPAVDPEGLGVLASLETQIRSGTGLVLVSINDVIAGYDTQISARTAAGVAANYTKLDLNSTDIIYKIKANASVVEGPSAGAAMTVATILVLENKTVNPKVMITGTIEEDGSIGPVGAILEKAQAAKENNATTFLVPQGLGTRITTYEKNKDCKSFDSITICQTTYSPREVSVGEEIGIEIKEVKDINEALQYFLK